MRAYRTKPPRTPADPSRLDGPEERLSERLITGPAIFSLGGLRPRGCT
jgi:hypothetical protein